MSRGIYVASKAKYGPEWKVYRDKGFPIISTWIDQSGVGETEDWEELWSNCIFEAASCSALVLIRRPGDELKGALVEMGAALAQGARVFAVGIDAFSVSSHPLVFSCDSELEAFAMATAHSHQTLLEEDGSRY